MALPAPDLDDRRFQDLVDEAKRLVQKQCPSWTDHNVSDPGVTLIELFAWMTDQVIYRLNRVPDRMYVKFLDLLGVRLFPPTAARAPITFWLAGPQPDEVRIQAATTVATVRTEVEEAIAFTTLEDLAIVPSSLARIGSRILTEPKGEPGSFRDHGEDLARDTGFQCFNDVPLPGDALYIGLPRAVPSCAIQLRFACEIQGLGIKPDDPPLGWQAWDGDEWVRCELAWDGTAGLNQNGDVVLHVPRAHVASTIGGVEAGWVRAEVEPSKPGRPDYRTSPKILSVTVTTIGGTIEATNTEVVESEDLGVAEGVAGQRFILARRPVVPGDEPPILQVVAEGETQEWQRVGSFAESGPTDRHFGLDEVAGEVHLGPGVRLRDGSFRSYGAVPPKGARLVLRGYRTGAGSRGNVAPGTLRVLKSSIPYVARVENRHAASGGVDGEDVANAKIRGPIQLRTRGRAVTAEDYEEIAREAAPELARVRALTSETAGEAGTVRLLVVPAVTREEGPPTRDRLQPTTVTLRTIKERLDAARVIGVRVVVEPPHYRGVSIAARLRARPRVRSGTLAPKALAALYAYFDPLSGGPDGTGWPFGRPVIAGEVYSVLQAVQGVELVEDVRVIEFNLDTGQQEGERERIAIEPNELVLSVEHAIEAVAT